MAKSQTLNKKFIQYPNPLIVVVFQNWVQWIPLRRDSMEKSICAVFYRSQFVLSGMLLFNMYCSCKSLMKLNSPSFQKQHFTIWYTFSRRETVHKLSNLSLVDGQTLGIFVRNQSAKSNICHASNVLYLFVVRGHP